MVVTRHMKRVSQLRSFSASSSSTTSEEAAQDSEGEEAREEVRGWVSIRKSSETIIRIHDGKRPCSFTLEEDEPKDGEEVDEDEREDEGEDDGTEIASDGADHILQRLLPEDHLHQLNKSF